MGYTQKMVEKYGQDMVDELWRIKNQVITKDLPYEELIKKLVKCNESLNYVEMESLLRKAYHYFESMENPKHKGKKALKEEVTLFNQLKQT